MAELTHLCGLGILVRAPPRRMRIAAKTADSMAADAVGRRTLVVARRALDDLASRGPAVELRAARISRRPTPWMRAHSVRSVAAHMIPQVARVAT